MSELLRIRIGGQSFKNPVFLASGCCGNAFDCAALTDLGILGAVSPKTVTYTPRAGNKPPRICEIPSGVITSIGLQGPGIVVSLAEYWPKTKAVLRPDQILYSIAGSIAEEYLRAGELVAETISTGEIAALEVNAACPNVHVGGGSFSKSPTDLHKLVADLTKRVPFPVIVKINTNTDNYCDAAKAAEDGGATALYTTNTPMGMAIDIHRRRPAIGNTRGGISGPAVLPIGICKTWDIYRCVKIPIIASGGVSRANDVLQYIMAGATAVGIGSAFFVNPNVAGEIVAGLEKFCLDNNVEISELVGAAHTEQ